MKQFLACLIVSVGLLFSSCSTESFISEPDASIEDDANSNNTSQPTYELPSKPKPPECKSEIKGGLVVPTECFQGPKRLEEIPYVVDPAPELKSK